MVDGGRGRNREVSCGHGWHRAVVSGLRWREVREREMNVDDDLKTGVTTVLLWARRMAGEAADQVTLAVKIDVEVVWFVGSLQGLHRRRRWRGSLWAALRSGEGEKQVRER